MKRSPDRSLRSWLARRWWVLLPLVVSLAGCNGPPLYQLRAREYLEDRDVSAETVETLVRVDTLDEAQVLDLLRFEHVAVLHLLGRNPGTPTEVLRRLASHENFEVRTGVAANPGAPLSLLRRLRTPGRYTTENCTLAGNAAIHPDTLSIMLAREEASLGCFARNPGAPRSIMEAIIEEGRVTQLAGLASNPGLPEDLFRALQAIEDPVVQQYLRLNPNFERWSDGPEG